MNSIAEIKLWGSTIGAVSLAEGENYASFEYDKSFIQSRMQVAPLMMPLSSRVYRFPLLSLESFHGLPGMLADSLPDKFGNAVIDEYLARKGRLPESFNAVERLCYTGIRGMGALEFFPAQGFGDFVSDNLDIGELVGLASQVLQDREGFHVSLLPSTQGQTVVAMQQILQVGTSAGGARAKAVIAWNPKTNEVRSGQIASGEGFQYWLLKFDGVQGNKDKELADSSGYGRIEFAYYLMACAAGLEMSECRLFSENGRNHFMTRRFDRTEKGEKLHMQSLGALAHYDFNQNKAYSYEQVFSILVKLGLPHSTREQFFRRMVFNIVARNQDDHVKNIAFLMDKEGNWTLAPAYDVTYSYQEKGIWTGVHQMAMNGKREGFLLEDFSQCGKYANLVRGRAEGIVREVCDCVREWRTYAKEAGVPDEAAKLIGSTFRMFY